jgi:hypothetical protein
MVRMLADRITSTNIGAAINVAGSVNSRRTTHAFQFRDQRNIDQEAIELAQTFGLQATLALQLTKMAEQSKQIAIAKEQELFARQRAAALARANDALRGCLDALASVPELDEFLEQVMAAIARQLGAKVGRSGFTTSSGILRT